MNNFFRFVMFPLAGLIFLVSSCAKMDDLYKGTENQESTLFEEDVVLPEAFNWESSKAVDVRIAVDDNYDGRYFYRVELYDGDPKSASSNLLGAGVAKSGQDYVDKIMVPTALTYVYVKQTSPVGIAAISMIDVTNTKAVVVNKATSAGRANKMFATTLASSTASGSGSTMMLAATSTPSVTVPADAIELHDNSLYVTNFWNQPEVKTFVIKAGTTLTHPFYLNSGRSGIKVYVEGTWESDAIVIGSGNGIYVMSEGSLKANQIDIPSGGHLSNYGTAIIEELTTQSPGTIVRNEGSMTVQVGKITNASAVEALCHTRFEKLMANGANFRVFDGALLSLGNVGYESPYIENTTFNLESSAILDITEKGIFGYGNKIIGAGTAKSLARLKKVDLRTAQGGIQWHAITYSGNLEVACSDHISNGQSGEYYILASPAAMVAYDQSTVEIAATECNAGGNNDAGAGTDPDDQTTPEVSLGTYSYAFEDNWPSFGDYDMNDFVVDMDITKFQNTENKVTKVQLKSKLRSVGAAKRLAAAIQLDGVASNNVKGVTYSNSSIVGTNFNLSSNGTESGQTYAVVPITSDAHQAFGQSDVKFISTKNGEVSPVELTITVEFNTPLANFTYENLNVFIINFMQNKGGRNEVHLAGYKATDKINSSLVQAEVNSGLLFSTTQPFKSKKGYPWAIAVPVSFDYPLEAKNIKDVFPNFKNWAISGGEEHQDWYIK
ncbi:LruC domain-containing protein [Sphingobacterium sp. DN00404]|uniref:LruC domain-containing protein n=1 Tax=Sphingobacterium micropteri TaxID=2763501 RepID=A0ABR7YNP8_9SPHI|nr:LruC domain-containing protein [Sphingobacterium micropteri]MBD1432793.1 LruC domain-containing protein [Sphingobacterium micropteri]